jgi:type II secretory pathway component GspD/PulD (secretin)
MRRRILTFVGTLLLLTAAGPPALTIANGALFTAAVSPPLHGQQVPQQRGTAFNFQDADLAYVVTALATAAGIGFAYADLPQKPVTLRATLTRDEMLSMIRSLAEANGISVIEAAGMIRLQGSAQAIEDPRQLYIHRLRHARAPILAATLQSLFSGVVGGTPRVTATGSQTLTQQLQQMQAQQTQAQRPAQIVVGGNVLGPFGAVIVPDDATNSLLVRASPADWQVMQQAIAALDTRPLQVVIEVVIAEVQRTDDTNIGINIRADGSRGDRTTIGRLPTSRDADTDFSLRVIRTGDIDIEATLSALSATGRVRILSRPVILAQNNMEARINVGTERPFIQISRSMGTTEPFRDEVIQYRDVGTTLTILPTINEDGYVNMSVVQEINNATNEVQFGAPIISTRSASTQLLARDGQTVVIGGLIDRQTEHSRAGIPLLKDIPYLGALFGTTRISTGNSELFLFLTPHIVMSDEDADRIKLEIERNAELLEPLTPITPLIPPAVRFPPDTMPAAIRPELLPTVPPVRRDTIRGGGAR